MRNMSKSNFESYPPLFRPASSPTKGVDLDKPSKQTTDSDPLPVIDLQYLNHDKLAEACKDWGMFRLVNHGIPMTLLNKLQDHAKELFSLTFESKQALFTNPIAYFWGTPALTPSGVALQRGPQAQIINWVEGFNVLLGQLPQLGAEDPVIDSFGLLLEEYGRHQSRLATTIFEAMAENLKLGPKQSMSYLSPSTGFIRVYRYPRCSEAHQAFGIDTHTDSSVLSILNQDEVGGLQVYKDDQWLNVKPISNTLVVNLGDMMQAMSNDEYKSVKHRVKVNKHEERISIGYFVFPAEDSVIEASKYKPFTYADFRAQVQQDLRTIGIKVGLEHFKLTEAC
uniref:Fe2OG dioxygenase domain-containing protein n=1 Tax=Davidia involucrata TaxID=16924 RepID=A0A5B7BF90_DAVIN